MDYQQTLDFLYSQLPVYQKIGIAALNNKLDKTLDFCSYLGNPQNSFKTIHVAGTNGKGSVSHMLAAVLQTTGLKTGLYTSPHLKSFTERIKINGIELTEEFVVDFVAQHQSKILELEPSFFEITVVMSFEYFRRSKIDIAVIEVGLGGRFDSTNIITPILSIITNISLDHTDILGDTIEAIAFEKAGIIKPKVPVVIGEYNAKTIEVFNKKSLECKSNLTIANKIVETIDYELLNRKTVEKSLQVLSYDPIRFQDVLNNYKSISGFKGRWQKLNDIPKVYCDTGHNVAGVEKLVTKIKNEKYGQLWFVWGMVKDKDHDKVLCLLPPDAKFVFCSASIDRSLSGEELSIKAKKFGIEGIVINDVNEALEYVKGHCQSEDLIVVGGSTFVVAELKEL